MKTVYLIRHGPAAPRADYSRDRDRPLTDDGIARTTAAAAGFAAVAQANVILASPFLRARQTAEIFGRALDPEPNIKTLEDLAPVRNPSAVAKLIDDQKAESVAVVGHEPDMSGLTAWLCGCRLGGEPRIDFKKAGAARIDFNGVVRSGQGTLIWLLPPRIMAALAAEDR